MLTVLFGAGASYDSDPLKPAPGGDSYRPPLAKELFDRRFASVASRYRQIAAIANDIRRKVDYGENIEAVLANLEQTASEYPVVKSQLMAVRYYLRDLIDESATDWAKQCFGETTYADLVNRLNKWSHGSRKKVNYITFNYDVLLEEALINLGQRFDELEDYIKPPAVGSPNVIRPHGCVRWSQIMKSAFSLSAAPSPDEIISHAGDLTPTDDFTIGQPDRQLFDSQGGRRIAVPAIAIPVDNKSAFICPERHVNTLREILEGTRVLLIIGWRGTDAQFSEELRSRIQPNTDLFACNGSVVESAETIRAVGLSQAQMRPPTDMTFGELSQSKYLQDILQMPSLST
jgi:hypothetical protein